jgi:integrase
MSYLETRSGRKTGWWYGEVEVRIGSTDHRFRKRFQTKGEADGYEAYVRATGKEPPGSTSAPVGTFRTYAAKWLERNPTWGAKDPSSHQRLTWVVDQLGDMDIAAVTTAVMEDRIVDRLRKLPGKASGARLSNRTINRYLDPAANVLRMAHQRGDLSAMPHVPRVEDKGSDRVHTLSDDLEMAVCAWIEAHRDPRVAFVIRVFCETGMRRGELWKLAPEQIETDTENGWITLHPEQTKTEATRVVTLPVDMATKLRAMIATSSLPNQWQTYSVFKEAVAACGGAPELTLHSLRHTRATRLVEAGVESLIVAQLLGHKTLQTTKRYTHPKLPALAEAAKKVHQRRGEIEQRGEVIEFGREKKTG